VLNLSPKSLVEFLEIKDSLPIQAHALVRKFLILSGLQSSLFMISQTFYILYVMDLVSDVEVGILVAISFLIQAVIDYPSGVLGDWLGQRWILLVSFCSYGISFFLLAFATNFTHLLFVYILTAFASSQQTGALQSWFDNNYKFASEDNDPNRKIYQIFLGKINMLVGFSWAGSILFGGLFAYLFSREIVFLLQSFGMVGLGIISAIYVRDLPGVIKPELNLSSYFKIMGDALKFSFTKKHIFTFIIGICLIESVWSIWGTFILFPLYFGYTGTDFGAGGFRFLAWINQSMTASRAAKVASGLKPSKWLPITEIIVMLGYFGSFAIIFFFFPLSDSFQPVPIILTLVVFIFLDAVVNIYIVLQQRLYLDIVPDKIRNSIYSLIPTLALITSAPFVAFGGTLITLGYSNTLIILSIIGTVAVGFQVFAFRIMPKKLLSNNGNEL
jgi:MFS family permease